MLRGCSRTLKTPRFSEAMFVNREKLENLVLFGPGGHNFDSSEKLTEIVS